MAAEMTHAPETVSARIALTVAGTRLELNLTVPTAPVRLIELLPLFQALSDAVLDAILKAGEGQGVTVSCRHGCAMCCRHLVPVNEVEARRLRDVVEALPEPRRTATRARFASANRRLAESGLLDELRSDAPASPERNRALGRAYFAQQVACPFLEDEACSIYPDRPLVCRAYHVVSPAPLCDDPFDPRVRGIRVPTPPWSILAGLEQPAVVGLSGYHRVPLVLAPEWADAHPDETPARPAPEWVREFFERLSGAAVEAPESETWAAGPTVPAGGPGQQGTPS